ncbi:MAG: tetratricopeptide repeat protein [Chloroflexales bacterium]|nr:tetratricopeptide repeat protein [Chloroflexales bacterium]
MLTERSQLEQAIAHLESQRASLGDAVVDASIATLYAKLVAINQHQNTVAPTRMIGRDAELQQLLDVLHTTLEMQESYLVTITGEPGIGKSRLICEYCQWLERLPEPLTILQAWADQRVSDLPYVLLMGLLASACQITENDPVDLVRSKLEQGISDVLGAGSIEKAHFIGHLLGFDFSTSPYLQPIQNDFQQIHSRAIRYAIQYFAALAATHPVICLLEDIHWADESSLNFLIQALGEIQAAPLLIVCTTRCRFFERHPDWEQGLPRFMHMRLQALDERNSRLLVGELVQSTVRLPIVIRDLIVNQSGGNPYYIEELVKMLITDGTVQLDPHYWQLESGQIRNIRIPATITEVLYARLEALDPPERMVLECAAVVGRVFWAGAVARLSTSNVSGATQTELLLDQVFVMLQRYGLILEDQHAILGDEQAYQFKHTLLHELVYTSIPEPERARYHAQVAAWLIEQLGERSGGHARLIAEHYERAGESATAAVWLERAGKQAQNAYAQEAAMSCYHKALALLPDKAAHNPLRITLYNGLGRTLGAQAQYAKAAVAFETMRNIAALVGDVPAQVQALFCLSWSMANQGDPQAALKYATQAEDVARAEGSQQDQALALYAKGWSCIRLGDITVARAIGEEAVALSRKLNTPLELARSLDLLGAAEQYHGEYVQAVNHQQEALSIFRHLGDLTSTAMTLNNIATNFRNRGDYQTTITFFKEALATAREAELRLVEVFAFVGLARARAELGDYAGAEKDLERAFTLAGSSQLTKFATFYYTQALVCLGRRRFEEGFAAAQQSLDMARRVTNKNDIGTAWRVMGMAMAHLSEHAGAATCFAESERMFRILGLASERARTLREWACYALQSGDKERGQAMWQEAYALFAQLGMDLEVARMDAQSP